MYTPDPGSEIRFTHPRADCPNPQWWTSDDDDSTEHEVTELVAAFVRALQPELVLETGTAWGQTAAAIGAALKANKHGRLITLEPDPERAEYSRERCKGLPVRILEEESLTYRPEGRIDFAWFDSLIHLRVPEFMYYKAWMQGGKAVVGFHDTGPQHGLRPQVEAIGHLISPMFLPTPRGACFAHVF